VTETTPFRDDTGGAGADTGKPSPRKLEQAMKTQEFNKTDAGKVVLYVEDDPVNVLLMRLLFERRPQLRLEVATCGQQAMALAGQLQPVLLLLDLRLPDCFGDELLKRLRRQPGWHRLPAVAVTTEPDFEVAGSGFLELWRKPLDLQRALARLDDLLDLPGDGSPASAPRRHPAPQASTFKPADPRGFRLAAQLNS
jgi:CheY-like chemotaxis protein